VALVIFFLIRAMNRLRREEKVPAEATTKECPFCLSTVPIKATRCAFCTSQLTQTG
jgi:large conductance mechanosensitive channel